VFDVEDDQGGSDDFPIHGLRLMLRSALKVILIREFPHSPIARSLFCLVQLLFGQGETGFFGFLNATVTASVGPS